MKIKSVSCETGYALREFLMSKQRKKLVNDTHVSVHHYEIRHTYLFRYYLFILYLVILTISKTTLLGMVMYDAE